MSSRQLVSGSRAVGIIPSTFDDVQRVAKALVAAGMGSFGYKDTDQEKVAKATAQIMTGLELGVPPMQAMANIAIINGKPQVYGELVPALLYAAGFSFDMWLEGKGDDRVGHAKVIRPDGTERTATFSVDQAKQAGLWDQRKIVRKWDYKSKTEKDMPNDSPWYKYPDDMLPWKAVARAVKRGAPDVLKGVAIREDMYGQIEETMRDITPTVQALPEIPDVPDIPDIQEEQEPTDEPLADQPGFVEMLRSSMSSAESRSDLREIVNGNTTLTRRCSPETREVIAGLYREAM